MASKIFVQAAIPHFDGHYDHWTMLMENFLRSKEFWSVVSVGVQEPTTDMPRRNHKRQSWKINLQDKDEVALKAVSSSKGTNQVKAKWKGQNSHHKMEKSSSGNYLEKKKRRDKSQVECYRWHRFGHYRSECHTNLNRNRGGRSYFSETKEDGEIKEEGEEVSLLMAYASNEKVSIHLWYLDTGCSNHMCGQKYAFLELDESFQDTVRFGDNFVVIAMGKGNLESPNEVCEDCVVSKQQCEPFPTSKLWRAKKVLELVHSDICGPISPTSNGEEEKEPEPPLGISSQEGSTLQDAEDVENESGDT
uniref:Retrovirus-related Pol polyprotein from transposon TNT 1-94-like beta-barrel domain-containing protein n=1 Tax=Solanum demissum TaxID=50514 RepID=Q6L3S0_SOLDE|nr:hypothetical protein SDM1_41t00003 [Solanum demissum]